MDTIKPRHITFGKRSYVYSLLFHAAVFLLMLNVPVLFDVEVPQFHELDLQSISSERVEQILEDARQAEEAQRPQEQGMTPGERVDVPERRMLEIEEPTISVPNEQRIESRDIVTQAERMTLDVPAPSIDVPVGDESIFTMDRKETFEGSQITIGEEPGAGLETSRLGEDLVFEIEGEIQGRELISNPLPTYPEGLNANAVISIRCTVLPDGSLSPSSLIPVRKENAVLEELAIDTLKLWRFSPLPEGDERIQTGIVTFRFRLE